MKFLRKLILISFIFFISLCNTSNIYAIEYLDNIAFEINNDFESHSENLFDTIINFTENETSIRSIDNNYKEIEYTKEELSVLLLSIRSESIDNKTSASVVNLIENMENSYNCIMNLSQDNPSNLYERLLDSIKNLETSNQELNQDVKARFFNVLNLSKKIEISEENNNGIILNTIPEDENESNPHNQVNKEYYQTLIEKFKLSFVISKIDELDLSSIFDHQDLLSESKDKAIQLLGDKNATYDEIIRAEYDILTILDFLENVSENPDKSDLNFLIKYLDGFTLEDINPDLKYNFDLFLEYAKFVSVLDFVNQKDIDEAYEFLVQYLYALDYTESTNIVNKKHLIILAQDIKEKITEEKISDKNINEKLEKANSIINSDITTQMEVDEAFFSLFFTAHNSKHTSPEVSPKPDIINPGGGTTNEEQPKEKDNKEDKNEDKKENSSKSENSNTSEKTENAVISTDDNDVSKNQPTDTKTKNGTDIIKKDNKKEENKVEKDEETNTKTIPQVIVNSNNNSSTNTNKTSVNTTVSKQGEKEEEKGNDINFPDTDNSPRKTLMPNITNKKYSKELTPFEKLGEKKFLILAPVVAISSAVFLHFLRKPL